MSNPKEFKLGVSFAILVSFLFVGSCATSPRFTPEEARQARKSLRSVGGKKLSRSYIAGAPLSRTRTLKQVFIFLRG